MKGQSYQHECTVVRGSKLIPLIVMILFSCSPRAFAQWTQPDANQNINSTNTGNVGVGTTSPGAKLTVSSNTQTAPAAQPGTTAQIVGANGATARLVVDSFGPVASSIDLRKANNTASSPTAVGNNEIIGQITWQGYGATSYNAASRAKIMVSAAETYTDTAQGAFMMFNVAPIGGITSVEAMRIAPTGFVGLGTTTPTVKLDVFGSSAAAFRAVRDNATTDSSAASAGTLLLQNSNTTANNFLGLAFQTLDSGGNVRPSSFIKSVVSARSTTGVNGDLAFSISDGASIVEMLRLTSSSRVGIGTSTPNFKLDLQGGQINSSGGLCIAGDCKTAWSQVGGSQWTTTGTTINYGTGNVGIGVASPTTKLDVNGTVNATALTVSGSPVISSQWATSGTTINYSTGNVGVATAVPTEKLHVTGNVKVTGNIDVGGNINAKYQDMAEWVDSSQELEAGTVVVLDSNRSNQVVAATQAYDSRVAGVVSLQPGIALGEQSEGRVLVATTGRVKVRVDASNGPINIGDLLVTSDKTGVAMKSIPVEIGGVRIHRPGTLIGKALEPLAEGRGEILVLLSLQ